MPKRKVALAAIVLTFVAAIGMKLSMRGKTKSELNIAFVGGWKTIHPGLQHTLIGDLTLSNQFESLVGLTGVGIYVPLAARSWTISPDFRIFTFKIDTTRKFSDGVMLTARHFKESWENSFRLDPKSANSSLLDVLYKIEGFHDFPTKDEFTGVRAIDDDTLEIRFATPFRMALEHLSGNRFSAFRETSDGKFLGTGAYVIEERGAEKLLLTPNRYFGTPVHTSINLRNVAGQDAISKLQIGELDAVAYTMATSLDLKEMRKDNRLSTVVGQDAVHRALYLNGKPNRIFSKRNFRQALQYLVHLKLKTDPKVIGDPEFLHLDPQVYLPLQNGRLDESEVSEIIDEGEPFVEGLIEASRRNPIVVTESTDYSVIEFLRVLGLSVSEKSRVVDKATLIDIIYKSDEPDIITGNFGIASGDPDGIYHMLGERGAIASPMTKNVTVGQALEAGRKVIDRAELNPVYQNVSRTILREAPIVHLGFIKALAVYRNDVVHYDQNLLRRNEGMLQVFKVK